MQIGVSFIYAELNIQMRILSRYLTSRQGEKQRLHQKPSNKLMCSTVVMEDEHINCHVCQRMCSFKVSLQVKEGTVLMTRECLIRRNIFF